VPKYGYQISITQIWNRLWLGAQFLRQITIVTSGNNFKLVPEHYKYDLVPVWNSIPNDVVVADITVKLLRDV